jgi:hypothetical protein
MTTGIQFYIHKPHRKSIPVTVLRQNNDQIYDQINGTMEVQGRLQATLNALLYLLGGYCRTMSFLSWGTCSTTTSIGHRR